MDLNKDLFADDIYELLTNEITTAEVEELGIDINQEKFAITNEDQAKFFIRKINELRDEIDRIEFTCKKDIESYSEKVNAFKNREVNSLRNTENYFTTLLENYARQALEGSKTKSIKTAFGTLSFSKVKAKFEYDDKTILKFLEDNNINEHIRIKKEVNKETLKKAVEPTGDGKVKYNDITVEGITVIPEGEKFTVKSK